MRKILLWIHLAVGVTVAAIVMPMSVTGVLSMCEKQTIVWSDRGFRFASIYRRSPDRKDSRGRAQRRQRDNLLGPRSGCLRIAGLRRRSLFRRPYRGKVGEAAPEVRGFLGALQGESRAITGAAILDFSSWS